MLVPRDFNFLRVKQIVRLVPIDVLRPQAGPVRLRRAGVPEQFVKVPALGVQLPRDDGRVFLRRDGPLLP